MAESRYQISLTEGIPLGVIKGGNFDGEIIHAIDTFGSDTRGKKFDPRLTEGQEEVIMNFFKNIKKQISDVKLNTLHKALRDHVRPLDPVLQRYYDQGVIAMSDYLGQELPLSAGDLKPIWNPNTERQIFYIFGMSGSGKSYYCADMAEQYHLLHPQNAVFLISAKDVDPVIDKVKCVQRVPLTEFVEGSNSMTLEDLSECLMIMDDTDAISDKAICKEVERIKLMILNQGRASKTSMLLTSHIANRGHKTRDTLNEFHAVVVFPGKCTRYNLGYFLKTYLGFDPANISKVYTLHSRAVTIFVDPCLCVLYDRGIYMVK